MRIGDDGEQTTPSRLRVGFKAGRGSVHIRLVVPAVSSVLILCIVSAQLLVRLRTTANPFIDNISSHQLPPQQDDVSIPAAASRLGLVGHLSRSEGRAGPSSVEDCSGRGNHTKQQSRSAVQHELSQSLLRALHEQEGNPPSVTPHWQPSPASPSAKGYGNEMKGGEIRWLTPMCIAIPTIPRPNRHGRTSQLLLDLLRALAHQRAAASRPTQNSTHGQHQSTGDIPGRDYPTVEIVVHSAACTSVRILPFKAADGGPLQPWERTGGRLGEEEKAGNIAGNEEVAEITTDHVTDRDNVASNDVNSHFMARQHLRDAEEAAAGLAIPVRVVGSNHNVCRLLADRTSVQAAISLRPHSVPDRGTAKGSEEPNQGSDCANFDGQGNSTNNGSKRARGDRGDQSSRGAVDVHVMSGRTNGPRDGNCDSSDSNRSGSSIGNRDDSGWRSSSSSGSVTSLPDGVLSDAAAVDRSQWVWRTKETLDFCHVIRQCLAGSPPFVLFLEDDTLPVERYDARIDDWLAALQGREQQWGVLALYSPR